MKLYQYAFEKLEVWKKSKELVKVIYTSTEHFPKSEMFGLTQQMRRASVSVASNLAEGSARKTNKDKAHFTTIAYSSLMELLNQSIIVMELGYLKEKDYECIRQEIQLISYMLNSLRNSQDE